MNYNTSALAVAIAATLGGTSTAADAAIHPVVLTGVTGYSNNGTWAGDLSSSTATFSYNDVSNLVTQTGGIFDQRISIVPNVVTLFRHTITGLVIGNGAAASAATYVCTDGNFSDIIGVHLCGNYNFGFNFIDEGTVSYGPGTAFDRTIGGDDIDGGPQQSIAVYNGFSTSSWDGTTLVIGNNTPTSVYPWPLSDYQWTLSTVPVPPAVWLFGSALGVMGWMRRKAT